MPLRITDETGLAHALIAQQLRARLGAKWHAGERLPTIAELAQILGAGQRNTHRAVQALVQQGLLVSRPRHGTFVTTQFSDEQLRSMVTETEAAVALATAPTGGILTGRTIRLVSAAAFHGDEHVLEMIRAAQLRLVALGATVQTPDPHARRGVGNDRDNDLRSQRGSASAWLIVNPSGNSPLRLEPDQIAAVITPYGAMEVQGTEQYDIVTSDEVQAGRLAVQRLRACGVKRPCFVGARDVTGRQWFDRPSSARCRAFMDAWGQPLSPSHQLQTPRYGEDSGACALQAFRRLKPQPDGVFCAADELAVGFVMGALALGLEAGRDYHLIGFDGQQRGQSFAAGPLTTIKVPSTEMGARAAEMLSQRLLGAALPPQRVYLGCRLLAGSTARPEK